MMAHPPVIALARAKSRETFASNMCLKFVRTRYGVPGLAPDAAQGFAMTNRRHTSTPPPGVPVWWTGGAHGHVAISAGGGYVLSTDWPRAGSVGRVSIRTLTDRWNKRYRGWSEDINEVTVFVTPTVDLSALLAAAKADPNRPQGGTTPGSVDDVRLVEAALFIEGLLDEKFAFDGSFGSKTLSGYAKWQRKVGLGGKTQNGLPATQSLRRLGKRYGFKTRA
jgi:hypothetical protein